jgi:hypothetical protein
MRQIVKTMRLKTLEGEASAEPPERGEEVNYERRETRENRKKLKTLC